MQQSLCAQLPATARLRSVQSLQILRLFILQPVSHLEHCHDLMLVASQLLLTSSALSQLH